MRRYQDIQCSPIAAWVLEFLVRTKGPAYLGRIVAATEEDVFVDFLDDATSISARFEWRDTKKRADCYMYGPRPQNAIPIYSILDGSLEIAEPEVSVIASRGLLEQGGLRLPRLIDAPGIPDIPIVEIRRSGRETSYLFDAEPTRALSDILRDIRSRVEAGEFERNGGGHGSMA